MLNTTPRNVSPTGVENAATESSGSGLRIIVTSPSGLSRSSPTDLLSDLLLLRVPGAPLRTPDGYFRARAKRLTVTVPTNVTNDVAFFLNALRLIVLKIATGNSKQDYVMMFH